MKLKKINEEHYVFENNDGVITHSTQPIEIIHTFGATMTNPPMGYINIIELPLSEVKELLGEVDVEKKAKEWLSSKGFKETSIAYTPFVSGYNQALEDNKEKKYTEEDMRKAIEFGHTSYTPFADVHYSNFIQSLQPKTEWEVDIINGKLTLI